MKHFFRPLKQTRLRPDEFHAMRVALQEMIHLNPLPESSRRGRKHWSFLSCLGAMFQPPLTQKYMFVTLILTLFVALGGGTAVAAENAAPGDVLYPFKIHVNETVRGTLAVGTDAEADWQSTRAVRRLEEATRLAAEGRLSTDTREALRIRFVEHQDKAEKLLADLKADGKAETAVTVSSQIEANLAAFETVLKNLEQSRPTTTDMLVNLRIQLKARAEAAAAARAAAEADVKAKTEAAAENKLAAAEHKIAEVKKFIDHKKVSVDAAVIAQAKAKVKLAEDKLAEGKVLLEKDLFADAFVKFQEAHRLAQEAKLTLNVIHRLNISLLHDPDDDDDSTTSTPPTAPTTSTPTTPTTSTPPVTTTGTIKSRLKVKLFPFNVDVKEKTKANVNASQDVDDDEKDED